MSDAGEQVQTMEGSAAPMRDSLGRALRRESRVVTAAALVIAVTGCAAPLDERLSYLRETAERGVGAHQLLRARDVGVDKARCVHAYESSGAGNDIPADQPDGSASEMWRTHVKEVFVNSCIRG